MTGRILHLAESLDPAAGGVSTVVRSLVAAQRAAGLEARAACVRGADASAAALPAATLVELLTGRGPFTRALGPLLDATDVLHLHGVWDPPLIAAAKAARRAGKPYVVAPHGMLDPWSLAQGRWKKRLAMALGVRRMLDRAAAIQWLNDDERDLAAPQHLRAPAAVIPNGVSAEALAPPADPGAFRRVHAGAAPYILFLGRLHPKKGLDILAEAFGCLPPPVRLVVAGPDGGVLADFRSHIAPFAERVAILGPLYGAAKWAAFDDAACFVLPSRQEGFSVAILEAMARQCPVVVSEQCHFPEVGSEGAGRVAPLDAAAFTVALAGTLAGSEGMGRAGRALVERKYTWERVAEATAQLYADCRGSHP